MLQKQSNQTKHRNKKGGSGGNNNVFKKEKNGIQQRKLIKIRIIGRIKDQNNGLYCFIKSPNIV